MKDNIILDITDDYRSQYKKDVKIDINQMEMLKKSTPARIGIGHTGSRYNTRPYIKFLADQAAASDAVFNEVSSEVINDLGVFEVKTKCADKYEMLTRPDLGTIFDKEQLQIIRNKCKKNPDVQIYFGDGLCSPSIKANIPDLFPTIKNGLEAEEIIVGTPFFVRYCRVNTARCIGPELDAKVVCVLIGERPGLLTSESMSAYIAYKPRPEMLESEYTVVSNINRHGIPPVEAAAHIVEIIQDILKYKCSGIELSEIKRDRNN